jgi:hypothetical protein
MLISSLAGIGNRDFFRTIISTHVPYEFANFACHANIVRHSIWHAIQIVGLSTK